jgi:hypothetical protein
MPVVWIAAGDDHVRHPAKRPIDESLGMTQAFYATAAYDLSDLSEAEERHVIWEYLEYDHYDCRGSYGEVLLDGKWQPVWAFGSEAEAIRFAKSQNGVVLDQAAQARVTKQRLPEMVD